jgi:hypothetical protein
MFLSNLSEPLIPITILARQRERQRENVSEREKERQRENVSERERERETEREC